METNNIDLVQQIRGLKDYIILDRREYEKLMQSAKPNKYSDEIMDTLKSQNAILKDDLEWRKQMELYWKTRAQEANKRADKMQEELEKQDKKWWRF